MNILNFGSLNIDHVYTVRHIVKPGETIAADAYAFFAGGKGANQSVAIARAGGKVMHVGRVGPEGQWMLEAMKEDGVDVSMVMTSAAPGGHAVIQVDGGGQNAIVIHGGSNREIDTGHIDSALARGCAGDFVLLQNEINNIKYIMTKAADRGMQVCFNPAPMNKEVLGYPLGRVGWFFVNETEAEMLCGAADPDTIIDEMLRRYPAAHVIVTLGARGALYGSAEARERIEGRKVKARDTTAAGDTFIGYFLASIQAGRKVREALETANAAAALSVMTAGAQTSIPRMADVQAFIKNGKEINSNERYDDSTA